MFDPADTAYHPMGAQGLADLVEACVHLGDREGAESYLTRLESLAAEVPGTLLLAELAFARAIVADDEETYQEGLSTALATWPCYRGRSLLAYGAWPRAPRGGVEGAPVCRARDLRRAGLQGGRRASSTGAPRVGRDEPPPSAGGLGSAGRRRSCRSRGWPRRA